VRPAVYAVGVTVSAGGRRIVDDVDLTVGSGDWFTVVGPNGAGKTTLLRALLGLVPSTGRIELTGTPLSKLSRRERSRLVAFVPQSPTIPAGMTVLHYVLLGRTAHLGPLAGETADDLDAAHLALAQLELVAFADRSLDTLSGGELQRTVLARALAQRAPLLFLDEPTSALDIGRQQGLLDLVDGLRHDLGLTVVSTMHDLTLTAQYADHVVLLDRGKVVISGTPAQVFTGPQLTDHYAGARVDVIRHKGSLAVIPWRQTEPTGPTGPTAEERA